MGGLPRKQWNRMKAPKILEKAGLNFTTHNGGAHIKLGPHIDFWPGTGLWHDGETKGRGIQDLITHLKKQSLMEEAYQSKGVQYFTVEQIFEIAKKGTGNLYQRCEAIHKEIYGSKNEESKTDTQ